MSFNCLPPFLSPSLLLHNNKQAKKRSHNARNKSESRRRRRRSRRIPEITIATSTSDLASNVQAKTNANKFLTRHFIVELVTLLNAPIARNLIAKVIDLKCSQEVLKFGLPPASVSVSQLVLRLNKVFSACYRPVPPGSDQRSPRERSWHRHNDCLSHLVSNEAISMPPAFHFVRCSSSPCSCCFPCHRFISLLACRSLGILHSEGYLEPHGVWLEHLCDTHTVFLDSLSDLCCYKTSVYPS